MAWAQTRGPDIGAQKGRSTLRHLRKRVQRVRALELVAVVLAVVVLGLLLQRPITAHLKALRLLSNEFPQVPVKPLDWITAPPVHQTLELESPGGRLVADLFLPSARFGSIRERSRPALILAMGIKTKEEDKPILLSFADTMSRLGFAVLWPRQEERSVPIEEQHKLSGMDPSKSIQPFQARIFILHDKADPYVPYVQAIKLREALPPHTQETFLLLELFEHVQLGGDISWQTCGIQQSYMASYTRPLAIFEYTHRFSGRIRQLSRRYERPARARREGGSGRGAANDRL